MPVMEKTSFGFYWIRVLMNLKKKSCPGLQGKCLMSNA